MTSPLAPVLFCLDAASPAERFAAPRAILAAREADLLLTARPLDDGYLRRLRELGLGPAADRIIRVDADRDTPALRALQTDRQALVQLRLATRDARQISLDCQQQNSSARPMASLLGEFLGKPVRLRGQTGGLLETVCDLRHLRAAALAAEVSIPSGEVLLLPPVGQRGAVRGDLIAAISRAAQRRGKALVRTSRSGQAWAIRGSASLETKADRILASADGSALIIEELIETRNVATVVLNVDETTGRPELVGVVDRRADGFGPADQATFPSTAVSQKQMIGAALSLAEWAADSGVSGPLAFDFVEAPGDLDSASRPLLTRAHAGPGESLARLHRLILMAQRGSHAFVLGRARNINVGWSELSTLHATSLLSRSNRRGLLPLACDERGLSAAAFASSGNDAARLLEQFFGSLSRSPSPTETLTAA